MSMKKRLLRVERILRTASRLEKLAALFMHPAGTSLKVASPLTEIVESVVLEGGVSDYFKTMQLKLKAESPQKVLFQLVIDGEPHLPKSPPKYAEVYERLIKLLRHALHDKELLSKVEFRLNRDEKARGNHRYKFTELAIIAPTSYPYPKDNTLPGY